MTDRKLPIIIVPDKTYTDKKGELIPIDVILIADPAMYAQMAKVLAVWGKEEIGIAGKRGDTEG